MRSHAREFVLCATRHLAHGIVQHVAEVASHGAYLHEFLRERGLTSVLFESSRRYAAAARARGWTVVPIRLESPKIHAYAREHGPADLVIDNYLLAHRRDPIAFLSGLRSLLGPRGIAVAEFDHVLPLIETCRFDSIRHGHFSYFSLTALSRALRMAGLQVVDAARQPVYGGSLRIWIGPAHVPPLAPAPSVSLILEDERAAGLLRLTTYRRFATEVARKKDRLLEFLAEARGAGRKVLAYGAPSRGSTLLNVCGITRADIPFTVDVSPGKQGRAMPGSGIPIYPPERLLEARPEYVLILAWDLAQEIARQMSVIESWGGRFVVPIPEVAFVP